MAAATSKLCGHHPGKPSGFAIRRIVGIDDLWVTEYVINYKTTVVQTVSIMEFRGGKVIHETQYLPNPSKRPMAHAMGGKEQIAHGTLKSQRDKGRSAHRDIHASVEFGAGLTPVVY